MPPPQAPTRDPGPLRAHPGKSPLGNPSCLGLSDAGCCPSRGWVLRASVTTSTLPQLCSSHEPSVPDSGRALSSWTEAPQQALSPRGAGSGGHRVAQPQGGLPQITKGCRDSGSCVWHSKDIPSGKNAVTAPASGHGGRGRGRACPRAEEQCWPGMGRVPAGAGPRNCGARIKHPMPALCPGDPGLL